MIKHPSDWRRLAGDTGRPVTFDIGLDEPESNVRLLSEPEHVLESVEDAEAWLVTDEPTVDILGTQPVEQPRGTGYRVAYTYQDSEGDQHSGLALLLNDDAGTLYVARLHAAPPDLDLLVGEDVPATLEDDRRAVLEGFTILPPEARATGE
jgi:hypothetical protein